jgi:hypothetical protein
MTQRDDMLNDDALGDLFAGAQSNPMLPSDALMSRILEDAHCEQQAQGAGVPNWATAQHETELTRQNPTFRQRLLELLGGWSGATGLATATVAGLALGLGAPETVNTLAGGSWSAGTTAETAEVVSYAIDDLVPSFYDLAIEG